MESSPTPAKDFGPIENDYAFFMAHATEAENDAAAYTRELASFAAERETVRLLDFGCGNGDFSERLYAALNWPPQSLQLTLMEPVPHQRELAALRLARFTQTPITVLTQLPSADSPPYDVILSNHALYYVPDLQQTLTQMVERLAPGGKMLLAMAGWDNALMQLWTTGFALIDQTVPYYAAEDITEFLTQQAIPFRKTRVNYQLKFPDTTGNKLSILRFLFGEHLEKIPTPRLLQEFDAYRHNDEIAIPTHSEQFVIEHSC